MSIKLLAPMGVSVLIAAAALAAGANATQINGGGSSLIAPQLRQAADCYGNDLSLPSRTGATTGAVTIPVAGFARCAPPGYNSPTTNDVQYISTGAGRGILSLYAHDPALFNDLNGATPGIQSFWANGAVANGLQYGLSETPLLNAGVVTYDTGGTIASEGVAYTFRDPGPPLGPNEYRIPRSLYGPLVQFPIALAPVALAYDPIYKKENIAGTVTSYRFNINPVFTTLRLDSAAYCKILNGQITNWNDPAITALNGGVSLRDPLDPTSQASWTVPIELVGEVESSGTTQVLTRHLAAACGGLAGNNYVVTGGTAFLPLPLQAPPPTPVPGKFTLLRGGDGVAAYASFSTVPTPGSTLLQGRLAYAGVNYTLPAAAAVGLPYTLVSASLRNAAGAYREPTGANATTAFAGNQPPQTVPGVAGTYDPTRTMWGVRTNPADWVRVGDLANPTAATAYPIVGTVNFIGYTCYASSATADTLRTSSVLGSLPGMLNYWFDEARVDDAIGVIATGRLAPLPIGWQNAIIKTFLSPIVGTTAPATSQLNLFIGVAGAGANGNCNVAGVVGA